MRFRVLYITHYNNTHYNNLIISFNPSLSPPPPTPPHTQTPPPPHTHTHTQKTYTYINPLSFIESLWAFWSLQNSFIYFCVFISIPIFCCNIYPSKIIYNRQFLEITGEIIKKCEATVVGHHFRHRLLAYTGPWFQNGGGCQKALVCDSVRPSGMDTTHTHTHTHTHTDCSRNWVLILVRMEILWEEEGFQFGFKRWQGCAVSKVLWEWIPNVGSKARESTEAMRLAFVLLDFQHAGVRRRAQCTRWSVDRQQFREVSRTRTIYSTETHTIDFSCIIWSFWQGHMWCVHLEQRTGWIDCEHLLFTPCSWLRRNVKKKNISSLCCFMAYQKQITASRGLNTKPGIAKPVALFHHSHRIVDSSWQSSPGISSKDCFKYGKFWGVNNFLYKLISQ